MRRWLPSPRLLLLPPSTSFLPLPLLSIRPLHAPKEQNDPFLHLESPVHERGELDYIDADPRAAGRASRARGSAIHRRAFERSLPAAVTQAKTHPLTPHMSSHLFLTKYTSFSSSATTVMAYKALAPNILAKSPAFDSREETARLSNGPESGEKGGRSSHRECWRQGGGALEYKPARVWGGESS